MKEEIEKIKKLEKPTDLYTRFVYRVSTHIVYFIRKSNISPNTITFCTFILGLSFLISLMNNQLILASIFVFLIPYSDTLDGLWARYKKKQVTSEQYLILLWIDIIRL